MMNKESWEEAMKKLDELRETAVKNKSLAEDQLEELEFNISNYHKKIEEL